MKLETLKHWLPAAAFVAVLVLAGCRSGSAQEIPTRPGNGFVNSIGMEFVWVPAGEFEMGSESEHAFNDEVPLTRVRIPKGYWLGKHEVTQGQWAAVMGDNPSHNKSCGLECPVDGVSWNDVHDFIAKLNTREATKKYRLPWEAEWEYAVRAGTRGDTYEGDLSDLRGNDPMLDKLAWFSENSGGSTHPVGRKTPNALGLHDMLGNVWEWVQDWYGDYKGGLVTDLAGPGMGSYRVARGGSWMSYAWRCRSSYRSRDDPDTRNHYLGFRLLKTE